MIDDAESPDATSAEHASGSIDLTPTRTEGSPKRSASRSPGAIAFGVVLVLALGFVIFNGLTNAATYFYNVDEALAKQSEIGARRIRVQGHVVESSVVKAPNEWKFTLVYNGASLPVRLTKEPPDLFGPQIPVVLEGAFDGDTFVSDNALIKHDETYTEKNSDRIKQAETDANKVP